MSINYLSSIQLANTVTLPHDRAIGTIWRRFAAYLLDSIFLRIVGSGIGVAFSGSLQQLGIYGRLVGFCMALVYFFCCDSRIVGGQTIGKRLLKLRVIDSQGKSLCLAKSLLRSVIFVVPFFLYQLRLSETRTPWIISVTIFIIVLWVGGTTLYLIVFNQYSRQGLHDLAVGSYVANADDTGAVETKSFTKSQWSILGLLLVTISITSGIVTIVFEKRPPFPQMRNDEALVEQMEGVQRAHVEDILSHSTISGGAIKDLVLSITLKSKPLNQEAIADKVARIILQNDRNAQNYDHLTIWLIYGYDIGISQHLNHQKFTHTPTEWNQHVLGVASTQDH